MGHTYLKIFLEQKKNKKRKYNYKKNLLLKHRHIKRHRAPNTPLKDNFKGYYYSKRDNKTPKTLFFFYKSQDKIKEILGMIYYNCKKKGHIA